MDQSQIHEHTKHSVNYNIHDCKWVPASLKLVTLGSLPNSNGVLQIYELNDGKLRRVKQIVNQNAYKCGTFGASSLCNRHMAIGNSKGQLQVIDLERSDVPVYIAPAHEGSINAIDAVGGKQVHCGPPEIVTGGRDGAVNIWDIRQNGRPVAYIPSRADQFGIVNARSCWSVAFGDSFNDLDRCVAAGYDNGNLKLFDLRAMAVRWETSLKNGICGIEFDRRDIPMNKMGVVTLEGDLIIFDMRTQHGNKGFTYFELHNAARSVGNNGVISGPKATLWAIRHLPQNRDVFATCDDTGSLRLWHFNVPEKRRQGGGDGSQVGVVGSLQMLNATTISAKPIHCLDWHPDKLGLAVCGSFDQTVRVLVSTKLKSYD